MNFLRILLFFLLPFLCLSIDISYQKSDDTASEESNGIIHQQARRSPFHWFNVFRSKQSPEQSLMLKKCRWIICSHLLRSYVATERNERIRDQKKQQEIMRSMLREKSMRKIFLKQNFI